MDPFLRRLSFLMVLLVLAGCGQGRASVPPGKPYPVILAAGVIVAPAAQSTSRSSRSGGQVSGSCNIGLPNFGSGKDALVGLVVVLAVVIVVAVVVAAVDTATPSSVTDRYYVTLSGYDVPLEVVTITDSNHLYLTKQQYDAVVHGAYNRAVLRPAVWEGTRGAPTQAVRLSVSRGEVTIAPAVTVTEPPPAANP